MILDLRDEEEHEGLRDDLRVLRPTTQNQLVMYCKKRLIDKNKVEEIYLGDGGMKINETVGFASNIATYFNAAVHFVCRGSPGTCSPNIRIAAMDNYLRRRQAGERADKGDE
jgi:hypothetical protein